MAGGDIFAGMTTRNVVALAAMVMSAPMVMGFAPASAPLGLQQRVSAISRAASSIPTLRPAASSRCMLRMQEGDDAAAGVSEVSDDEQRSLSKTRTNKRPRSDNKNKKPLTDYVVGEMTKGKVVSIMPYGAFIDVGTTTDGLVHVSQIADEFVSDIESVVKVGDEVECRIVSVDTTANKISLSMRSEKAAGGKAAGGGGNRASGGGGGKKELPDEFKNFDDQKFLPGKVASVMDFGCFVSLNDDVDALVHVSEMSEERVQAKDFVKVGQEVQVRIIGYDKSKKRLSLSMKQWTEAAPKDETDDIKNYVDPVIEGAKTSFQMAWEAAQKAKV